MDHQEIQERLAALHDGELPESERAAVLLHAESCAGCGDALKQMKGIAALLRSQQSPADALKTDIFVRRVMAAIRAERRVPARARLLERLESLRLKEAWLIPALGLGLALLWVSIAVPPADANLPMDTMILAGDGGGDFSALAGLQPPQGQDVLSEALEANP